MKKLLALVLVLGMCSLANAALTIGVNPAMDTVTISGDGGTPSPVGLYLLVEGPASINGGTGVYPGFKPGGISTYDDLPALATLLGISQAETLGMFKDLSGKPRLTDLSNIVLADNAIPPAPLTGLLVDNIKVTWTGTATLSLVSDDFTTTYSSVEVPEPLTIALLGLGGLFLRRRR